MDWSDIFQKNLQELQDQLWNEAKELVPLEMRLYEEGLVAYFKGDEAVLSKLVESFPHKNLSADLNELLSTVLTARLQIRMLTVRTETAASLIELFQKTENIWRAEIAFVLAMLVEAKKEDGEASRWYLVAAQECNRFEMPKKSVKALQNHIAAESRVHKDKRFLVEYMHLYKRAKAVKERTVAGVALNNLSREYQSLGALKTALKHSQRALSIMKEDFGTLHFGLALAHHCHLLFELRRDDEALEILEKILHSPFPEVQEAVHVIQGIESAQKNAKALTKTWADRKQAGRKQKDRLATLEEKLLRLLAEKPLSRFELVAELYGPGIDTESGENRLKNLLNRVRKKFPGLIINDDGRYRISDPEHLSRALRMIA